MRILIVSDTSSHMRGGVPTETRTLINGLSARGHGVGLLADAPLSGTSAPVHFPMRIPVTRQLGSELDNALQAFRPDFVHVISMSSKGLAQLRPLLGATPWAATVHSVSPYERKVHGWHGFERLHYMLRSLRFVANSLLWRAALSFGKVPRLVVHSRFVDDIVRRYGYPADRLQLIPLPFETVARDRKSPATSEPGLRLVTVGGMAHTKGQHDLVTALPSIRLAFPDVTAQLIGEVRDQSYVDHLKTLADRLGVREHLLITPDLDESAKQQALESASIYVQPSHEEGFCLAYAEAAAVVPRLVGTATGAIAAISADDPGAAVVPPRAPQALAEAIVRMARLTLPADHLQKRAERLSTHFSVAAYIDAHEQLYRSIEAADASR